jgi:hypothetical protein
MIIKPWKNKSILIPLIISIISVIVTITINILIANEYQQVEGKTKALFGLKELSLFSYQYYVSIFGVVAIIFSLKAKSSVVSKTITILLAISTIVLVFLKIWRLLIY